MNVLPIRKLSYDKVHDVLRVFLPLPKNSASYDDEEYPDIIVSRSDDDDRISGVMVMDYSRKPIDELKRVVPYLSWESLQNQVHAAS